MSRRRLERFWIREAMLEDLRPFNDYEARAPAQERADRGTETMSVHVRA
jgi:hypothetical protein